MRRLRTHALIVLGAVLLSACGEPEPDREPGPRTLDELAPEIVEEVTVDGGVFDPDQLRLEEDQGIDLLNAGTDDVRIIGALDGEIAYDTGVMRPDEATVIVFDEAGTYEFGVDGEVPSDDAVDAPGPSMTVWVEAPAIDEG